MNTLRKVITPGRIVLFGKARFLITDITYHHPIQLCFNFSKQSLLYELDTLGARNMSQKSITSFFKITPKEATEISDKKCTEVSACTVFKLCSSTRTGLAVC